MSDDECAGDRVRWILVPVVQLTDAAAPPGGATQPARRIASAAHPSNPSR